MSWSTTPATDFFDQELQIPRGFSESDEEDELYEEAEDTRKQHSQFNKMVLPLFPTQLAEFKVHNIIVIKYFLRML